MSASAHELSVAVVVYRSDPQRLHATLSSLARACARLRGQLGGRVRLVVLDNGAAEAPLGELPLAVADQAAFDRIQRIDLARNLGYGAAHNRVLLEGCGDYHLVLNPDLELDPDALVVGIGYLRQHPDVVAVVPDGRDACGVPLYLAKGAPTLLVLLLRALAPRAAAQLMPELVAAYELHAVCARGEPADVQLGSGCCMLLRGPGFAAAKGFDPGYFLYFEDFDLSRRLAATGRVVYLPAMRVVHHGGGVARKGWRHIAYFCRSALRYFSRWGWRVF